MVVEFGDEISPEVSAKVRAMQHGIKESRLAGVLECIPTYRSLLVVYDPLKIGFNELSERLRNIESRLAVMDLPAPLVTELPTAYGGEYGPDLDFVAAHTGLSPEEVVRMHSSVDYLIYMIGFTAGYPYLGGLPESLVTPRRKTPRQQVPAGSVGIAGPQTGVYPVESPGGWQLIGRTPVRLYDPTRNPPVLLRAGDYVRFVPISPAEFESIAREVNDGTYVPRVTPRGGHREQSRSAPTGFFLGSSTSGVQEDAEKPQADALEVLDGGFFTTVQDLGRYGYQQFGIPPSGAMDSFSMTVGNMLVGNPPDAAGLEITYTGPRLRALRSILIAVTGADFAPRINGHPVNQWESLQLNEGDILEFGLPSAGARCYIAVLGGISVKKVMGSRSTYVRGNVGGLEGRRIAAGDRIPAFLPASEARIRVGPGRFVPPHLRPVCTAGLMVRAVPGPQDDYFTKRSLETFFGETYSVTEQADRMGLRLKGPQLEHREKTDIISDGMLAGAVQVPGDGQPIVMLADRQTTGGYPKIATVIGPDLHLLGQARPGDTVRFTRVTVEEAREASRTYLETLRLIQQSIQVRHPRRKTFLITVSNITYEVQIEELEN